MNLKSKTIKTLFKDSEVFQKDRPTKATDIQIEKFYLELAQEVIINGWLVDDKEVIIKDLKELTSSDTAFEKGKYLDREGWPDISIELLEWLDDIWWRKHQILRENIKAWVKAHDIKPKIPVGAKIKVENNLNMELLKGSELFINRHSLEDGCYVVDKDRLKKGGTVIPYERIEKDCIVIENK